MNQPLQRTYVAVYAPNIENLVNKVCSWTVRETSCGILSGFRLASKGIARDQNSSIPVALFRITLSEKEALKGILPEGYQISEVKVLQIKRRSFCKAYVIHPVEKSETHFEPSQDEVSCIQGWLCTRFPEVNLGIALVGHGNLLDLCYHNIFKSVLLGEARRSLRERTTWGGEHFVISPMPRSPRDRDDIAYIQRNPEECQNLVDFMYFMKHFAYTEDDPMRYRYVIGMLGETCSEYANAPYTVLCEKLIARATELLK